MRVAVCVCVRALCAVVLPTHGWRMVAIPFPTHNWPKQEKTLLQTPAPQADTHTPTRMATGRGRGFECETESSGPVFWDDRFTN